MNTSKDSTNNINNKNMNTNNNNTIGGSMENPNNHNNRNNMYPNFASFLKTDINKINNPIYSTYNMVDIDDILYFFSKDVERDKLLKLFQSPTTHIETTTCVPINITRSNDLFRKLIHHLDTKYKPHVANNQETHNYVKKHCFNTYLNSIDKTYAKLSCDDNKFSGWNYYDENSEFIQQYFSPESILEPVHSTENRIIPYTAPTIERRSRGDLTLDITPPIFIPLCSIKKEKTKVIHNENTKVIHNENTKVIHNENLTNHTTSIKKNNVDYVPEYTYVYINVVIQSIDDILMLIEKYPLRKHIKYNINMRAIHAISPALSKLNGMIGLSMLKDSIVDQIIYYIQDFHRLGNTSKDFMHTVIYGPPGTGKTEIAKIIGEIFSKLGMLKNNTFKKVTRADLVAGYLGQTAIKTKNIIKECLGGVLFIDEAYALGNNEKGDSFSKECIDTLCEALSDYKDEIMVIIAGYKDELKNCFFNYNEGLESRFAWRFATQKYTACELKDIFIKKVKDAEWELREDIANGWFETNYESFKHQGRDIETLFSKTKIAHSRRVFCKPIHYKTRLTSEDLEGGFVLYIRNLERNKKENLSEFSHMYV